MMTPIYKEKSIPAGADPERRSVPIEYRGPDTDSYREIEKAASCLTNISFGKDADGSIVFISNDDRAVIMTLHPGEYFMLGLGKISQTGETGIGIKTIFKVSQNELDANYDETTPNDAERYQICIYFIDDGVPGSVRPRHARNDFPPTVFLACAKEAPFIRFDSSTLKFVETAEKTPDSINGLVCAKCAFAWADEITLQFDEVETEERYEEEKYLSTQSGRDPKEVLKTLGITQKQAENAFAESPLKGAYVISFSEVQVFIAPAKIQKCGFFVGPMAVQSIPSFCKAVTRISPAIGNPDAEERAAVITAPSKDLLRLLNKEATALGFAKPFFF
jgi:predicted Zn-ribbon and HTH transcriptional regulator